MAAAAAHPPHCRRQHTQQPSRRATPTPTTTATALLATALLGTARPLHARCCGAVLVAHGAMTRCSRPIAALVLAAARPFFRRSRPVLGVSVSARACRHRASVLHLRVGIHLPCRRDRAARCAHAANCYNFQQGATYVPSS